MPDDPTIPNATCPPFAGASARDLLAGILLASGGDPANIPNTTQCREWGYGRYTERDLLAAILLATGGGGAVSVIGDETFSTGGTTTYNESNLFQRLFMTGSGGYTRKLVLSDTGMVNGNTISFLVSVEAGSGAVLEIYNDSIAGTLLFSYTASATNNGLARLDFIFDGTEWIAASPNEVFETVAPVIPPLLLFLEADTLALSDGDPVTLWESSSPGTLDATEDTGTPQPPPIFKASIVNSLPVVRFNNECLIIPETTLDAFSILLVAKVVATPSQTLLGHTGAEFQQALTFGAVGINPATGAPGPFPASLYSYDGFAATVPTSEDIGDPSVSFRIYEYNRTESGVVTCKVDGATIVGFTEDGGGVDLVIDTIGNLGDTILLDADIALLKVWDGILPISVMASQTVTFAAKYGITL